MTIFFIILTIFIILLCSSFKINIKEFKILNKKILDLKIVISIAFLNEINLLQITIDKEKIAKWKKKKMVKNIIQKIKEKVLKDYTEKNLIKIKKVREGLQQLKFLEIKDVNINSQIGTKEAHITALVTTLTLLFITFCIARKTKNTKYEISPVYIDKNYFRLSFKCIISIKLVHIINIAKTLKRKESDKKDGRTTDRRAYANSNG